MTTNLLPALPRLFCKPSGKFSDLHSAQILNRSLIFRSFDLEKDLATIHQWVNQHYAKRFWQMDGDIDFLSNAYRSILNNNHAHSFIGLLDEQIICLIDVYQVACDELKNHLNATENDCGLHLLMAPPRLSIKDLSYYALYEFLVYYFSFPEANKIFAEPDKQNLFANQLAIKTGFQFEKTIQLSYKTANLYSITKNQFHVKN